MRQGLIFLLLLLKAVPVWAEQTEQPSFEVSEQACERLIQGESRSSARVRATDKAVFMGVKKAKQLSSVKEILDEHEVNVMVYRLVDEYVEDLTVETIDDEPDRICVKVRGWLNPMHISEVKQEFIKDEAPVSEPDPEKIVQAAAEAMEEVSLKPEDPENLALVYIKPLEYYNGTKTSKFLPQLKTRFADSAYFYLTEEDELADYVVSPKVLKAKVDNLDNEHKRLQMVVSIEIDNLKDDVADIVQNRFVLFDAEQNEQEVAKRLIGKLLDQGADSALRQIEHAEQLKLEENTLGKTISE